MPTIRLFPRDVGKTVELSTNALHKVIIERLFVDAVEMEDIHFHHNSAVVLPWRYGESTDTTPQEQRIAGLSVIVAVLKHAKSNPAKQVLLAGHADSSGGADYNRNLSKARAQVTKALLAGDKDGWGKLAAAHAKAEDLQLVLAWVAEVHGWPCHPGAVDDDLGPRTQAARRAFRERYNRDFSASLPLDAPTSAVDWKAVFDLYELGLHDELGADLAAARSALKFRDPVILACGEDFAQGAARPAGMRSASDRRVDILFLEPGAPYPDFHSETPPGRSIYGRISLVPRTYLPVDPPVQLLRG
jgi:hypothetical protein